MGDVVMVYSEAGGVTKTTSAVSLAMCAAAAGRRTVLVDLDPRAATTKWTGVTPHQDGWHSGAILKSDDAAGWVRDLVVPSAWSQQLGIIPAARSLSNREAESADGASGSADHRLRRALAALDAEVIVLDHANRAGGPLTRNALNAATRVVYASNATPDGIDGVDGARETVAKFIQLRDEIGAPQTLTEAGIIVGAYAGNVPARVHKAGLSRLAASGLLLNPQVPARVIVQECRATHTWYGEYQKGKAVMDAYSQLLDQVIA